MKPGFMPILCSKEQQDTYTYASMYRFGDNLEIEFEV